VKIGDGAMSVRDREIWKKIRREREREGGGELVEKRKRLT